MRIENRRDSICFVTFFQPTNVHEQMLNKQRRVKLFGNQQRLNKVSSNTPNASFVEDLHTSA